MLKCQSSQQGLCSFVFFFFFFLLEVVLCLRDRFYRLQKYVSHDDEKSSWKLHLNLTFKAFF